MKLPRRVLFAGAHCDDVELFAGGLLARACEEGLEVGVLVFSDHRGVLPDRFATQSREELRANLAWLSRETGTPIVDHSTVMIGACDGSFLARRAEIYAALEGLRDAYDLVVTHASGDSNQDHGQVVEEARRALKAHVTLIGGEFPNNDLGSFRAGLYVALSTFAVEAKVKMIEGYASQRRDGRPYLEGSSARALARVRGSQIRVEAAEAFEVVRVALR